MYHRLESAACPVAAPEEQSWAISASRFAGQMQRLHDSGGTGVSMDQIHQTLASGSSIPPGWVGITFDDGNTSDYLHALPVLLQHGFHATFFVCVERMGSELSAEHVREMHAAGMHIGSHAMRHRFMSTLSATDERDELVESRAALEQLIGKPVDHFAPPGGRWSARTRDALREAGYVAVSTSRYGFNDANTANFAYCRLPVVRATTMNMFDAMVGGDRTRLWKGYARAVVLGAVRSLLGEANYGRARALGKDR
jgi:peptidoglycan/xylan/chitin deacetylase (PgdA/CDA1 family)